MQALGRQWHKAIAAVLACGTFAILALGHREVGYARDEGIYFAASRSYAAWFSEIRREGAAALSRKRIDTRFTVNHEHPALLKTLAGLSASLLAIPPAEGRQPQGPVDQGGTFSLMQEGAAMRLPAQILAALAVALLYLAAAASGGVVAGLVASLGFITLPHVAFHAGLHAFDVPVAVAILAVVLAYRRALSSRRWAIALGPILGLAIAVKHNALFVGPLLAFHYYGALTWARAREHRTIVRGQLLPLPLVSMALLAAPVAFALWPWLWGDPWPRLLEYFAFHGSHAYYNMEFLGQNYNQPPMPIAYPWVLTFATVPLVLLTAGVIGFAFMLRRDLGARDAAVSQTPGFATPIPDGWNRHDGALLLGFALFPLVLISLPSTPIFGGTKHWITSYPFLALAAGHACAELVARSGWRGRPGLQAALVAAVLAPAVLATRSGHPHGLSQYAPLVGGARGAADLGLGRGFWGCAMPDDLPGLNPRLGPRHQLIDIHDVHDLAREQYTREGRWPFGLQSAPATRADAALHFHELHTVTHEVELWNHLGTTAPTEVVTLHGVPLTSVYARGRLD